MLYFCNDYKYLEFLLICFVIILDIKVKKKWLRLFYVNLVYCEDNGNISCIFYIIFIMWKIEWILIVYDL